MLTVTIPELKTFLKHVAVRHNEPALCHGQPGAGKTEAIMQLAAEMGAIVCDVRLGQYDSVDLRGIPVPEHDRKTTTWYAPLTLPFKGNPTYDTPENAERLIFLFLDELGHATPAVQGPTMQLVNEKRIGEHELLPNVRIIAATNRDSDGAVHQRMTTTVTNRFTHVEVGVDADAWCFWAQSAGIDPMGIAFMQFRKPLLSNFKRDQALKDKAFATPRTWEKALRYYADPHMPEDTKRAAMQGAIGEGPCGEFWGFVSVCKDMPDIKTIIANPDKVPVPEEASLRYAVSIAISGAMTRETVTPLHSYLLRMDPEFGVLAWLMAMRRDIDLTATKEFIEFAVKHNDVLAFD